ncbi:MAG: M81 family metallopeptidase [Alphaproteobacteria bacterium]|nr:M81 family metallopeptidase [Alphaproteobacteria bacterium]
MRLFVGLLAHETHRASPVTTRLSDYAATLLVDGDPGAPPGAAAREVLSGYGILEAAAGAGLELAVGLLATAHPSAPTEQADYERLRDRLLAGLAAAGPVDLVLLHLHGAQMATACEDCEGDVLARVRATVGPETPVGVLLDLHANVTRAMLDSGALFVACKEYPHVDYPARAAELVSLLVRARRGEIRPVSAFARVPAYGLFPTTRPAMRGLLEEVAALERARPLLSISLAHGFPWSDFAEAGAGVLVVADGDERAARAAADRLADEFFALYDEIAAPRVPIAEALARAAASRRPAILADSSDNAGGGAASDSTFLLAELIARGVRNAALGMIFDPAAVALAHAAGEGARVGMSVGGKAGPGSGAPVEGEARILAVREGLTQEGLGLTHPLGRTAAIEIGGVAVVLTDRRNQVFDPACFTGHGIDPAALDVLVVKSSQHFVAGFAPLGGDIIYVDAPGTMSRDFAAQGLRRLARPARPLDRPPFTAFGRDWGR